MVHSNLIVGNYIVVLYPVFDKIKIYKKNKTVEIMMAIHR